MEPVRVAVLTPTHGRPERFAQFVREWLAQSDQVQELSIVAWADGAQALEYAKARAADEPRLVVGGSPARRGKPGYAETITDLWRLLRETHRLGPDLRIVQIADDFSPCPGFYRKAETLFTRARARGLGGVRIHRCKRTRLWNFSIGEWEPEGVRTTTWNDGDWYSDLRVLHQLRWKVHPQTTSPNTGSKIWRQVSHRLRDAEIQFLQPIRSLVLHDDAIASQLNPQRRGSSVATVDFWADE